MFLNLGLYGNQPRSGSGLLPPSYPDLLFYGKGGVADGTDNDVNDLIGTLDSVKYVGNNCLSFNGTEYVRVNDNESLQLGQLPYTDYETTTGHQGIATEPDYPYFFLIDTAFFEKRLKSDPTTVVATNSNPFAGLPSHLNHLGDGCLLDGKLYIPITYNPTSTGESDHHFCVYDADTMLLTDFSDVSADSQAGTAYGTDGTYVYSVGFYEDTRIERFTMQGVYVDALTASKTLADRQGIAHYGGELFVTTNGATVGGMYVFDKTDGSFVRQCVFMKTGEYIEGLDFSDDDFNAAFFLDNPPRLRVYDPRQKLVKGFGIRSVFNLRSKGVDHQSIIARYGYSFNQRQYYLHTGPYCQFRVGNGGAGPNVQINSTTGWNKLHGWYDTSTAKIYITDGTLSNDTDLTITHRRFDQSNYIGSTLSANFPFDGEISSIELYHLLADGTEVVADRFGFADVFGTRVMGHGGSIGYIISSNASAMRTTSDSAVANNLTYGFDLWTNDASGTKTYAPIKLDGTSYWGEDDTIAGYTWVSKNPPNLFHNGAESSVLMTDWKVVDGITLNDGTAFDDVLMTAGSLVNSVGSWNNATESIDIEYDGSTKWQVLSGATVLYEVVNSDSFPPRTGWTAVNGTGTLGLIYNDVYVDKATNEFRRVSYDNIITQHDESNGSTGNWFKLNNDDLCTDAGIYQREHHQNQTESQLKQKEAFFGGESAALRDVDSELILYAGLPQIGATEIS